jgi:hypothetical protein
MASGGGSAVSRWVKGSVRKLGIASCGKNGARDVIKSRVALVPDGDVKSGRSWGLGLRESLNHAHQEKGSDRGAGMNPWLVRRRKSEEPRRRQPPNSCIIRCGELLPQRSLSTRPAGAGGMSSEAGMRPSRNMERSRDLDDLFETTTVFYKLRIITGDLRGAGTTEDMFVEMHGDDGSSGRKVLKMPLTRASTVDVMIKVSGDLGRLQRMEVGFVDAEHALKTKGSGWLLDRIETFRIDNSMRRIPKPVIFPCQRWIGESESGSRSGGPLQTLFPLAMELSYPRLGALAGAPRRTSASASADMTLCAVAAGVPHPDKVAKGVKGFVSKEFGYAGEDAYIAISKGPVQLLAMADGVASWWQHGIDAGEYSRQLVNSIKQAALECVEQVLSTGDLDWRKGSLDWPAAEESITPSAGGAAWGLDPADLLWRGWDLLKKNSTVAGSCTACIVTLGLCILSYVIFCVRARPVRVCVCVCVCVRVCVCARARLPCIRAHACNP